MANETLGETLSGWQELTTSLATNSADLPHLEAHRAQLADLLKTAQDLGMQQAAFTASKQEVSKKLEAIFVQGRQIAAFLRVGVKQHYGPRAEKLVEFGMRPFRGRRSAQAKPPAVPPPTVHPPTTHPAAAEAKPSVVEPSPSPAANSPQ
jgi:hypothetical protein